MTAAVTHHLHHPDGRRVVYRPLGRSVRVERWAASGWLESRYALPLAVARKDYDTKKFLGFARW